MDGDIEKFVCVFNNFLMNVLKYGKGVMKIVIEVECVGLEVVVMVKNNGVMIL